MKNTDKKTEVPQSLKTAVNVSVISRKDEAGGENECHTCKSWLWGECRCKHQH